jgi:hypothetical protein
MSKEHFIVTINEKELRYVGCCDCGLVHEVSYDIFENKVDMHFVRDEGRTEKARIKRAGGKGKLFCLQLDEAIARDPVRPDNSYKESSQSRKERKSESVVVGTMIKSLLDNAKSRNRVGIRGYP